MKRDLNNHSVVVSNGAHQCHLLVAGEELTGSDHLNLFITCGYPGLRLSRLINGSYFRKSRKLVHLAERRGAIEDERVVPIWTSEAIIQINPFLRRVGKDVLAEHASDWGFRWYSRIANRHMKTVENAQIYHYRSGFGHSSVNTARKRGMLTICDHSIAHPLLLRYLIYNGGKFPKDLSDLPIGPAWRSILADLDLADYILVNSQFVKDTFTYVGWPEDKVRVIYLGVDEKFIDAIPERRAVEGGAIRLLFAGNLSRRKGGQTLLSALQRINDVAWTLDVVASIESDVANEFKGFLRDPRIRHHGLLPRRQLALAMSKADVFVFPSLAEGSARVVFEAMAAGCYIITTPNAGSIVRTGTHGDVVKPDAIPELELAIRRALASPEMVATVGASNYDLVRRSYTQKAYGVALRRLYEELLASLSETSPATYRERAAR
jgi:glycosyltransferase involved in cell wall biosynthesis